MSERTELAEIGRLLTQEEYEDLEATVRRHHDYLIRIVELLGEQEQELQALRTGRRSFPDDLANP